MILLTTLFVFTAAVCICVFFKFISVIAENPITFPYIGLLSPTNFVFMYPSMLFQVAFWTDKLAIIAVIA